MDKIKDFEIKNIINSLDTTFGLSLTFDKRDKPCILIRLGYKNSNPLFQRVISGDHAEIINKARKIRDDAAAELIKKYHWDPKTSKCRVNKVNTNTSGVVGVRFARQKAKSGNGWYLYWHVSWSDVRDDKPWPRAKGFYFSKYDNDPQEAFYAALDFRKERELEKYNYTLINPIKYLDYWKKAKRTIIS
jgi:hypothetical protein